MALRRNIIPKPISLYDWNRFDSLSFSYSFGFSDVVEARFCTYRQASRDRWKPEGRDTDLSIVNLALSIGHFPYLLKPL